METRDRAHANAVAGALAERGYAPVRIETGETME
jgi:hypothetical protein